ncbi:MAG: electron transport complex subunit RsxB [Woeseiaceae bacterium]
MWTAVLTATAAITGIALLAGLLLGIARRRLPASDDALVDQVNELLPQTQCAQCGYPGCRPYAAAIVRDAAPIDLCAPGGADTVRHLAELLGRDAPAESVPAPLKASVAVVDEALCIGCTHCRDACPVDAIIGAHHYMHTVIASECTGCELCVARCPVDCIRMVANG